MAKDRDWCSSGFKTEHAALKGSGSGHLGNTSPTPKITSHMKVVQHRSKTANRLASFLNVSNHFARDERRKMRDSKASSLDVDWSHLADEHNDYQPDFKAMCEAVSNHVDAHPFDDLPANLITNVLHVFSDYRKIMEQRDQLSQDLALEVTKHAATKALLEHRTEYAETGKKDDTDKKAKLTGKAACHDYSHPVYHECHSSTPCLGSCGSSTPDVEAKKDNGANVKIERILDGMGSLRDGAEKARPTDVPPITWPVRQNLSVFPTDEPPSTTLTSQRASRSQTAQDPYHTAIASHIRGFSFFPGDDTTLSHSTYPNANHLGQDIFKNTSISRLRPPAVDPFGTWNKQAPPMVSPTASHGGSLSSRNTAFNVHGSGSSASSDRGAYERCPRQKSFVSRTSLAPNEMAIAAARAARKCSSSAGIPEHSLRNNSRRGGRVGPNDRDSGH